MRTNKTEKQNPAYLVQKQNMNIKLMLPILNLKYNKNGSVFRKQVNFQSTFVHFYSGLYSFIYMYL